MTVALSPPRPIRRRPRRHRTRAAAWVFLLPLLIVNALVIAGPGLASFGFSFTDWDGLGEAEFVGFSNYIELAGSPAVQHAIVNNLIWTAFFLVVPISMALFGAFLVSRLRRGQAVFRVLYFIPYVLATIVSATIWRQLLSPTDGLAPALTTLGVPFLDGVNFLGNKDLALGAVAFVNTWQWWGFLLVLFLAAMQGVDPSLYEAARLDGANAWREFWHITLPGIRPTFMFLVLMTVIWSFLVFDYIYILTQGGPAGSTDVLSTVLYRSAFSEQRAGYASAIAVVLSGVAGVVVALYLFLRKKLDWDV